MNIWPTLAAAVAPWHTMAMFWKTLLSEFRPMRSASRPMSSGVCRFTGPTSEDNWLRDNFDSFTYPDNHETYKTQERAYRYGGEAEAKNGEAGWDAIVDDVEKDWARNHGFFIVGPCVAEILTFYRLTECKIAGNPTIEGVPAIPMPA
jgi:hypothetical protein